MLRHLRLRTNKNNEDFKYEGHHQNRIGDLENS